MSGGEHDVWERVWAGSSYARPGLRAARAGVKADAVAAIGRGFGGDDRVLDLACGSGHAVAELAARERGRPRWVACDRSAVAVRSARSTFRRSGLEAPVLRADAKALPFRPGSFDAVLAFMVLQHLRDPEAMLGEIDRVLAVGGTLLVITPNRYSLASLSNAFRRTVGLVPHELRTYSATELLALLAPRFGVEALRPWHLGFDRPVAAVADRVLGSLLPSWGRYLVARSRKRSSDDGS